METIYKVTVWFAALLTCLLIGRAVLADELCGLSAERIAAYRERIEPFRDEIQSTLRSFNVDEKFIWLAMVESGGDVNAVSGHGAEGLWQLTAATARHYGCPPERRRNVDESTQAAAKYLAKLLQDFGGNLWDVIVAYNMGGTNYRRTGKATNEARRLANTVTCLMENYKWDFTTTTTTQAWNR